MNESNKKMLCSPNLSVQKPRVCVRIYCDALEKIYAKPIPPIPFLPKILEISYLVYVQCTRDTVSTVFLGLPVNILKKTDFL